MTVDHQGEKRGCPWWRSFIFAWRGTCVLLACQRNARVHLLATAGVIAAGFWFQVSRMEWAVLVVAMAMVWMAEGLNSAVEKLADAVHPADHPLVGVAKDMAAGAVLITAVASVVLGLLVFGPYLARWI